ncbi:bifunctional folylpolyglutamate synthase/dihydrofolate synthase [Leptospira barantonii]|uniref:Dihydrofolate synthase/folylpolyglutamate synthase n=1 Tax=Leptospira barantonii TaxID=2023184 RepID=A0A5F2AZQ7_9LEPT|nr:cyanophycin synthetase [Leptospira barantonii]TGL97013.1 bifunctional folylpolyglutamate synthase/dihydrofolate synthase [Leptospira barantonii]
MNSTSDFFDFISGLSNLEKTRNFNVFTGYSLEPFANVLKKYGFDSRKESSLCRISVVGTNAKGSITHFLGEYFRLSGFKTGLYTSPHLISPLERIRIGNETNPFREVTEKELNELLNEWKTLGAETDLKTFSFFELFTCASFRFFEKESVEIQIYEAGLGGRLDATKLCDPDIVVLGIIGLDHKEILGNSKEEILLEKLGICTSNTKAVFAIEQTEPHLNDQIRSWCDKKGISCFILPQTPSDASYLVRNKGFSFQAFLNILNLEWTSKIRARFEQFIENKNVSDDSGSDSSVFVSDDSRIDRNDLKKSIEPDFRFYEKNITLPPGRLSVLRDSPRLVFDPAHNPDAFSETLKSLNAIYPIDRFFVLVGVLKDKDGNGILEILRTAKKDSKILDFRFLKDEGFALPSDCLAEESIDHEEFFANLRTFKKSNQPSLVLGSFRLFPIVSDFLGKNEVD